MSGFAADSAVAGHRLPDLDRRFPAGTIHLFLAVSLAGLSVIIFGLRGDLGGGEAQPEAIVLFLLGAALSIALGFEFVNGFHDTANAAATVIYTHSLPPNAAVAWSGLWNFAGVLFSTGAVAFGIVSLLPVELILQAGQSAGFAMVFALLLAATIWNLATWYFGLPASSSHALIGSVLGVGLVNQSLHAEEGYSGIDWPQVGTVGWSLLVSPLIGFLCAALLLELGQKFIRNPELYREPAGAPPPLWIRSLLILTCSGVSFAHGSNDGQKGMGLIMLILIGTMPAVYALNRSMPDEAVAQFTSAAAAVQEAIGTGQGMAADIGDHRRNLIHYVDSREFNDRILTSLSVITGHLAQQATHYGSFKGVPAEAVHDVRSDMYLASKSISMIATFSGPAIEENALAIMRQFKVQLDRSTQFIPAWVKIAVAIALGLGTMLGWKRVVVTVGEKIGKRHLTYAQGASAEVVAMATIFAADSGGLPVSTTHVLSSAVAGAMAASRSGLQWSTLRNLALAWLLTVPAAMAISGILYFIFQSVF